MNYIRYGSSWSTSDPYIIQPYYTGRDKGPICGKDDNGEHGVLTFFNEGSAWKYVFETVQPDDDRAASNYKVMQVSEFEDFRAPSKRGARLAMIGKIAELGREIAQLAEEGDILGCDLRHEQVATLEAAAEILGLENIR